MVAAAMKPASAAGDSIDRDGMSRKPSMMARDAVDMLDDMPEGDDDQSKNDLGNGETPLLAAENSDGKKHDADFDAFASDSSLQVQAALEATPVSHDPTVGTKVPPTETLTAAVSSPDLLVVEEETKGLVREETKDRTRYVTPKDFELLRVIGMGAFGKVLQVRNKHSKQIVAMKVISKRLLKRKSGYIENVRAERDIMTKIRHPFVVTMHCSFQTRDKLFIIMDFLGGGELFLRIGREGIFLEKTAAFYLAEIVLALDHLHTRGILHRDLKPENILLSKDGHVCLTDFGLAKDFSTDGGFQNEDDESRARTVCGTQEYMAPEMVARKGYGRAADYWSLGCIAYEMLSGQPPFISKQGAKVLFSKIMTEKVKMPTGSTPAACKLLKGLLNRNVSARLGAARGTMFEVGGVAGLKQADFFKRIDWEKLEKEEIDPPDKLHVDNDEDLRHFHDEFTKMPLPRSVTEMSMERSQPRRCASDTFRGFSFVQQDYDLPARHSEELEKYWTNVDEDGESESDCASSKVDLSEFDNQEPSTDAPGPEKKKRPPRKRKKKKGAGTLSPLASENGERTPPPSKSGEEKKLGSSFTNVRTDPVPAVEADSNDPPLAGGNLPDVKPLHDGVAKRESAPVVSCAPPAVPCTPEHVTEETTGVVPTPQQRKQPKAEQWEAVGGTSGKKPEKGRNVRLVPSQPSPRTPSTSANGPFSGLRPTASPDTPGEKSVARSTVPPAQQVYRPAAGSWAAKTSGHTVTARAPMQVHASTHGAPQNWTNPNQSPASASRLPASGGGWSQRPTPRARPAPSGDWRQHSMVRQSSETSSQPSASMEGQVWPSLGEFPPVGSDRAGKSPSGSKSTPKGAWASKRR